MKLPRLRLARTLSAALVFALSWLAGGTALAAYPEHPIRLIVPFPPGGGADNLARTIVPRL